MYIRLRTEFSFKYAIGMLPKILANVPATHAGIVDRHGTWGHIKWAKECKRTGKHPIFGVELAVVKDMEVREKQTTTFMGFLALNDAGLRELYELTTLATFKFYYMPRIDWDQVSGLSDNIVKLSGSHPCWDQLPKGLSNFYIELNQVSSPDTPSLAKTFKYPLIATNDNLYNLPIDKLAYDIIMGDRNRQSWTSQGHILNDWAWLQNWPGHADAMKLSYELSKQFTAKLPVAELLHPNAAKTLQQMCEDGIIQRGIDMSQVGYAQRLKVELELIYDKKFEDYFFIVADLVAWAKERMFVGPARGSSCGSLACYLLGITDIDPMPYGLLFERFIDINREDLPDIDIDFQDNKRELVFEYLRDKYGADQVTRLGTVGVFKAKSALGDCAKELGIPKWEIADLKSSIIERSTGDSRAAFCVMDTFEQLEVGRMTLQKYPELAITADIEGHAHQTGMHAAGILVTAQPITHYCAVNANTGTAMIDKHDADDLSLLKIDALGLRTLSVLQDTLDQIGKSRNWLQTYPTDDKAAFEVLNQAHFAGIFQFEGYALQSVTKQMTVGEFEDIVSITALARPGPLNSGGATEFIRRRVGQKPVVYLHELAESITKVTYGVIIYQEQVMQIARTIGSLSWEDVSTLRKAMSKSMGKEFFDTFWLKFWDGAKAKGIPQEQAQTIWDNINTMGSWAFNRSHAVAYGMMSYWCAVLKANHPLEFAAACLRNAKDDDQSIKILRELLTEGYTYKPYDRHTSIANWSVQGTTLVGGLTAIKGVGAKLAETILRKRDAGKPFTPREENLLSSGETPWDRVFECAERWGHILREPHKYGIESELVTTDQITLESEGVFVFIAKITEKNLRDHNELQQLAKRAGKRMEGQTLFLNLTLEDDCGPMMAIINRFDYLQWGLPIVEKGKIGEWYIWKGSNRAGFRKIRVARWKKLSGEEGFASVERNLNKNVSNSQIISESSAPDGNHSTSQKTKQQNNKMTKNLTSKPTRDIDINNSESKVLVEWYNENSGSKPIEKFKDRADAIKRCSELKQAMEELAGGASKGKDKDKPKVDVVDKAKAAGTKVGAKAKAEPAEPAEPGTRGRKSAHAGKKISRAKGEDGKPIANPRREGSHGWNSFAAIKDGMTYEAYAAAGGRNADLAYDVEHGFVTISE